MQATPSVNKFEEYVGKVSLTEYESSLLQSALEVITANKLTPNPTSFFGFLYRTCLSMLEQKKFKSNEPKIASIMKLLQIFCDKMTVPVKLRVIEDTTKFLVELLSKEPSPNIVKYVIRISGSLLKDNTSFENAAIKLHDTLLKLTISPNKKLANVSIQKLKELYQSHYAIWIEKTVPLLLSHTTETFRNCKVDEIEPTQNTLELLNQICKFLPLSARKSIVEIALRLSSLGSSDVTESCMKLFGAVFESFGNTSSGLTAAMINAIMDSQPNKQNSRVYLSFMQALQKGYITLAKEDPVLCANKIPFYFENGLSTLNNSREASYKKSVTVLIVKAFSLVVTIDMIIEFISQNNDDNLISKILNLYKAGLGYTFQPSWEYVLEMINFAFRTIEKRYSKITAEEKRQLGMKLKDLLKDIVFMTKTEGKWKKSSEKALASALSILGASVFMEIFPLKFPSIDFPVSEKKEDNLWLLKLFQKELRYSRLSHFGKFLYPIAEKLEENAKKAQASGRKVEFQLLNAIQLQIWETFPSFCNLPVDIPQSFKIMAEDLCKKIVNRRMIRNIIANGIQSLIHKNQRIQAEYGESIANVFRKKPTKDQANTNLETLKSFSSSYLPVLLNMLLSTDLPEDNVNSMSKLAYSFASIAPKELIETTFLSAANRLISETGVNQSTLTEEQQKVSERLIVTLTDVCTIFVPFLESKNVELLFKTIKPQLTSNNSLIQKKSLKVLHTICSHNRTLTKFNLQDILKILEETEPKGRNTSTKKIRMKIIKVLFEEIEPAQIDKLNALIPEVIMATREMNARSRKKADEILRIAGKKCSKSKNKEKIRHIINIIAAGLTLTSEPMFVTSTMVTLTHFVGQNYKQIDDEYKRELLLTASSFLQSPEKKVVEASLTFTRMLININSRESVRTVLPNIAASLNAWDERIAKGLRQAVKIVVERLIVKLGPENVLEILGNNWTDVINYLRKMINRRKKKSKNTNNENPGDSDLEAEDEEEEEEYESVLDGESKSKGGNKDNMWLVEGQDDEIIDFLEGSAAKHIHTSDPNRVSKKVNVEEDFEKDEDGRIIIEDLMEDENKKKKKTVPDVILDIERTQMKKLTQKKHLLPEKQDISSKYRSTKSGGDVKKKGQKFEPYSYIPLDPKQLNKRRRFYGHKNFKGLVGVGSRRPLAKGVTKPKQQRRKLAALKTNKKRQISK